MVSWLWIFSFRRRYASSWSPSSILPVWTLSSLLLRLVRPYQDVRYEQVPGLAILSVALFLKSIHVVYPKLYFVWSVDPCVQRNPWHSSGCSQRRLDHDSDSPGCERAQFSGASSDITRSCRCPDRSHQQGGQCCSVSCGDLWVAFFCAHKGLNRLIYNYMLHTFTTVCSPCTVSR